MSVEFDDTEWASQSVDGSTLATVAQTIAGMTEAGKTEWFPSYVTSTTADVVSDATVTVKTKVTLPQWSSYGSASQSEQTEWDRFCGALRAHEQGHLDLVTQQLSDVDQQMIGQSSAGADSAWKSSLAALTSASDTYDTSTDHGRNQGTIINVSP
ncbi:MAG TPA: DUF922 domain-containing protein [Candidatus Baltobacteraceae bacterium]|nr:DUF922 domain-containing protein [Candidatus Baltobacteraceae bacterium]